MKKVLVIGSINCDYVINVPKMPETGETLLCGGYELAPGGKGANQAYALAKLGGKVAMLGAVGDDGPGEKLLGNLRAVGVDVSEIMTLPGESTGTAFIFVDSAGSNSILVSQGANLRVNEEYIKKHDRRFRECDIVVLQLEIPLDTVLYCTRRAKELQKTVILDPAPARADIPRELYRCVDYIKPNEVELGMLLEDSRARNHLEESTAVLQSWGVKNVVVTMGDKGAFLRDEAGRTRNFPPVTGLQVVDTTAAGDSFTAALAYGLSEGGGLRDALELAIYVSGLVVTRRGAQTSIPGRERVKEFMARNK